MSSWDDLRIFLAIARAGSLSGAAKQLGVNHSTMSRRLTSLEEQRGVRLFDRSLSGFQLTEAGQEILFQVEEIEQKNMQVDRMLFARDSRLSGPLTLTIPHDLANHVIIPKLQNFRQRYPDIDLQILVSADLKNLAAREADLAVRVTASPPEYLIGKKIADLSHGVYASKSYLARRNTDECKLDELVLWRHETQSPKWVDRFFGKSCVSLRVDDLSSMYAAVKAGLGLARMPCFLPDTVRDEQIVRLDYALKPSAWGLWILHHADLRETSRLRACKQAIEQTLVAQKDVFEGGESRELLPPLEPLV